MVASRIRVGLLPALAAVLLAAGCVPLHDTRTVASDPLPALPLSPPPPPSLIITSVPDDLEPAPPVRSVTLTAVDVDIRALLPALAEAADVNLVMGPNVEGRVTVNFVDIPADEAIRMVLAEAGLMIEQPPFRPPWAPVVFYALPINIQTAEPELLRERFQVSAEMAQWLVETRIR